MKAIQKTVKVKPGGRIEVQAADLPAGTEVEVFVYPRMTDADVAERVRELRELLADTRATTRRLRITEEEIEKEIAAVRAERR